MTANMVDGNDREDSADDDFDLESQNNEMSLNNNGINGSNTEDTLQALLMASLNVNDAEDLNDMASIAGEYSSLNNTIDELNSFLDRWDERHDRLRAQIREALEEDERERANNAVTAEQPKEDPSGNESKTSSQESSDKVTEKENTESSNSSSDSPTDSLPPPS
ncbi:dentin sialophosphoprotein [Aplysia californica]|uniref:Dentin sialophosphoprotein n=1 Tax=Aplysia californica TaxID=6500 RepID=A0ABM0K324_APLCA|nr:dentin sialophosphoprotein [Aplysia californica]